MGATMHVLGSQGHTLQVDLPREWAKLPEPGCVEGGGQQVLR